MRKQKQYGKEAGQDHSGREKDAVHHLCQELQRKDRRSRQRCWSGRMLLCGVVAVGRRGRGLRMEGGVVKRKQTDQSRMGHQRLAVSFDEAVEVRQRSRGLESGSSNSLRLARMDR